jgi:hypothetical protein
MRKSSTAARRLPNREAALEALYSDISAKSIFLSLLKTRFEHIDGVVRQGLDTRQCLRIVRLAVCRARPSPVIPENHIRA